MEPAILIQELTMFNQASILAISDIDNLLAIKTQAEKMLEQTSKNQPWMIAPILHIVQFDMVETDRINHMFERNKPYPELFDLIQDLSLVETY